MAAIVMLIFKNTILSLVAGMRIFTEDTFQRGDWVEVPGTGANGTIIDISLHSVKIRNFDNTVVSIPTHLLMDTASINLQAMVESGMRKIERAILVDQHSIRCCDDTMLDSFQGIPLIADDIRRLRSGKAVAADGAATEPPAVDFLPVNNFSIFRTYVMQYLRRNPHIRQDAPLRVRPLESAPTGIPLQIYAFADTALSVEFDAIQADVFDHIIIMTRKFALCIYQRPSDLYFEGEGTFLQNMHSSEPSS